MYSAIPLNVPALVVLNAVPPRGDFADEVRKSIEYTGAPCEIGNRIAFVHSYITGFIHGEKKRHIYGYFPVDVHKQLRLIGFEQDKSCQLMLTEVLNMYFTFHDKSPIA